MYRNKLLTCGLIASLAACAADSGADDPYAADGKADSNWPSLRAGAISYTNFVKSVFRVSTLDKPKSYLFLGDKNGALCSATMSFTGGTSHSEADIDVREGPDDDDYIAGVQIQDVAKLSIKRLEPGKYDFTVKDTTCSGLDDAIMTYADNTANPTTLSAIATTVRENGCHAGQPYTLHERSCDNLEYAFSPTYTNVEKVKALMKTELGSDPTARRITASRFGGCFLNLGKDGHLDCAWDVSDDPEGDTGDIQHGVYELAAGKPVALLETYIEDKW